MSSIEIVHQEMYYKDEGHIVRKSINQWSCDHDCKFMENGQTKNTAADFDFKTKNPTK